MSLLIPFPPSLLQQSCNENTAVFKTFGILGFRVKGTSQQMALSSNSCSVNHTPAFKTVRFVLNTGQTIEVILKMQNSLAAACCTFICNMKTYVRACSGSTASKHTSEYEVCVSWTPLSFQSVSV